MPDFHLTSMVKDRAFILVLSLLLLNFHLANAFSQTRMNASSADSALVGNNTNNPSFTYARDVLPIFLGKCFSCHNDQTRFLPNWSDYKTAFEHRTEIKRRVWDSWKGHYYKEPMPAGNSPQNLAMTDSERLAIKSWVEEGAAYGVPPAQTSANSKAERIEHGQRIFSTLCAACHQPTGQGIPERFPPLAGSDFLNSDKNRAIKTVLNGRQGEIVVNGRKFNNVMPKFPLSDDDIANALTYVYNSFGNSGKDVTSGEVKALRGQKDGAVEVNVHRAPSPFE